MKVANIRFKEIISAKLRFDALLHLSEGVSVRRMVSSGPYPVIKIEDVSERVWHAERWRRVYVTNPNTGITLLGSSAILRANLSGEKLISRKYTEDIEDKTLKKGWTLISCSGTIGKCAFSSALHAEKLASQHVIRLKPNNILRGGLIYAYLSTKYGYSMLCQNTFGSVIRHIEPQHVKEIPIPVFPDDFQVKVDALIQESADLREMADKVLNKAIKCFDQIMLSSGFQKRPNRISIKEIKKSITTRFDATYFITKGSECHDYITANFPYKTLGEVCKSISRPDIFKRYYVRDGIGFLGISDILKAIPNGDKQLSRTKTDNIKTLMVSEGTILIPRSGTIGDVVLATSQHAQKLVSEDVIRVIPNDILRGGYVYAFLASSVGKALLQRMIFGSVIQHIEPSHLKTIPIPILGEEEMVMIDECISQYGCAMGKAATLELEAISMVDQEMKNWSGS